MKKIWSLMILFCVIIEFNTFSMSIFNRLAKTKRHIASAIKINMYEHAIVTLELDSDSKKEIEVETDGLLGCIGAAFFVKCHKPNPKSPQESLHVYMNHVAPNSIQNPNNRKNQVNSLTIGINNIKKNCNNNGGVLENCRLFVAMAENTNGSGKHVSQEDSNHAQKLGNAAGVCPVVIPYPIPNRTQPIENAESTFFRMTLNSQSLSPNSNTVINDSQNKFRAEVGMSPYNHNNYKYCDNSSQILKEPTEYKFR